MKKFIQNHILLLILCMVFCAVFCTCLFAGRTQPHVDEVWSYMLSNKHDSPFLYAHCAGVGEKIDNIEDFVLTETMSYQAYFRHWHDGSEYHRALTVQPDERFAYDRVYYNQTLDVHPPLYYFVLHTICSLFPDQFSWWYAYSINLVCYLGTMIMLFLIAQNMGMGKKSCLLCMLLWGLSAAGTGEICFLRMYMMLTFFMMCITFLHLCLLREFRIKYIVGIMVLDIFSFLTQYYAYIYVCFITLICILCLFCKKQYRRGILYGISILCCVGVSFLLFPAVFDHVFSGVYSESVTYGNHASIFTGLGDALSIVMQSYVGFGVDILLAGISLHVVLLLLQFSQTAQITIVNAAVLKQIGRYILTHDKNEIRSFLQKDYAAGRMTVFASILTASAIIIMISPNMGVLTVRYLFLLLPLFSIFIIMFAEWLIAMLGRKQRTLRKHGTAALFLLCAMCITGSYVLTEPSSFLQNAKQKTDAHESYFDGSRIVFVDSTHHTQAFTPLMMHAAEVYPADALDDDVASILKSSIGSETPLYLVVRAADSVQEETEAFLSETIHGKYSMLGGYYCTTDDASEHYFYRIGE